MIKYKLKIGNGMIEFEGANAIDAHKFGAIYGALPEVCDNCKSKNIYLSHKSPQENDYYMLSCKDCGAELNFHQKKKGGFFLKFGEKMQVYRKSKNAEQTVKEAFPEAPESKKDVPH